MASTTAVEQILDTSTPSGPDPEQEVRPTPSPSAQVLSDGALVRASTEVNAQDDLELFKTPSTFHIYQKKEIHKCISPTEDPRKERWNGPTVKELKAKRKAKKARKGSGLGPEEPDYDAFFLRTPYLAFHMPPRVLYVGNSKHAKPAVLIHEGVFWREFKLQLGPSLAQPGVIDPRGVVSWPNHGGDKKVRKADDRKLKGYKVRTWRLWGEPGKEYVHSIKANRAAGTGMDPDVVSADTASSSDGPVSADEVVYLRWTNPLSRHTRRYHFAYAGIDFYWKGTGTVKESRMFGPFLRFNHLKLVAKLPRSPEDADESEQPEVCLGKYTSSIAKMKNGKLDFFDTAILRLVEDHAPTMLHQNAVDNEEPENAHVAVEIDGEAAEATKMKDMKRSTLYQVIVATAMCMIIAEKEKRHTIIDIILSAAEGGSGAGG